jgi:putative hydrolase of the HAD superfamily
MMNVRAVLFDLDGTLLNRRETFRCHLQRQLERLRDLFPAVEPHHLERMVELDANGYAPRPAFYRLLETEFRLAPGAAARLVEDFDTYYPEICVAVPNLASTLTALRAGGCRLGLITNGETRIQGRKIDRLGIRPLLDIVVISEAAGVRKPDPRIFAGALAEFGVEPAAAVYVGDDPDADIAGAKRSGLFAIWKRDRFWTQPEVCDGVIDDLSELPAMLGLVGG